MRCATTLTLALLAIIATTTHTTHVAAFEYIGCFVDKLEIKDRDMRDSYTTSDSMTPLQCEESCAAAQFPYFAVQYGNECWCSLSYGSHGPADEAKCDRPCGGAANTMCGGTLFNSVYKTTMVVRPAHPERPLIALVMIVKNEAHTLPNTLPQLKGMIDYYYILDTGSTDGTEQAVVDALGTNGEIHHGEFINYGITRNAVMDIATRAEKTGTPPVFMFMLSADETVHHPESVAEFAKVHRYSTGNMHEAYPIIMDVGWQFDSLRLSRTEKKWRYVGAVHEYLAAPDQKWHDSIRIPASFIRFRVTDPERRGDRELRIAAILEKEKEKDPTNARTAFYLARTYNVLRNHTFALAEFQRRVDLGGWREEVYEASYAIGWSKMYMERPWPEIQQAFLEAHAHSPHRAEPLHAIADHYARIKQWPLAFLFALQASRLPYPSKAVLWVQADVYQWKCHYVLGVAAEAIGEYKTGARALVEVLKVKPTNTHVKALLRKFKEQLSEDDWLTVTGLKRLKALKAARAASEAALDSASLSSPGVESAADGIKREIEVASVSEKANERAKVTSDTEGASLNSGESAQPVHHAQDGGMGSGDDALENMIPRSVLDNAFFDDAQADHHGASWFKIFVVICCSFFATVGFVTVGYCFYSIFCAGGRGDAKSRFSAAASGGGGNGKRARKAKIFGMNVGTGMKEK